MEVYCSKRLDDYASAVYDIVKEDKTYHLHKTLNHLSVYIKR